MKVWKCFLLAPPNFTLLPHDEVVLKEAHSCQHLCKLTLCSQTTFFPYHFPQELCASLPGVHGPRPGRPCHCPADFSAAAANVQPSRGIKVSQQKSQHLHAGPFYVTFCVLVSVRFVAHLYAAEALTLLDRVQDALQHLNPESVTDISTLPPSTSCMFARVCTCMWVAGVIGPFLLCSWLLWIIIPP